MKPTSTATFPNFDQAVPDNGYLWWYVDAVSDDGQQALTLIAFIGSVFSPYYARARQRRAVNPLQHCALNVALYSRRGKRWAMTERSQQAVYRSARQLQLGPSCLTWDGESLHFDIDEVTVPIPSRLRGQVCLRPTALTDHQFKLDNHGHHQWHPIAPCARVEVALTHPARHWCGRAYWDSNRGSRPLEQDFVGWDWSRTNQTDGTAILYQGRQRPTGAFCLALTARPDGTIVPFTPPAPVPLPPTGCWRMARRTRAECGQAKVLVTLEDTPFYSRSLLQSRLMDKSVTAVHESLCLDRFRRAWVRCLLPFRAPRAR